MTLRKIKVDRSGSRLADIEVGDLVLDIFANPPAYTADKIGIVVGFQPVLSIQDKLYDFTYKYWVLVKWYKQYHHENPTQMRPEELFVLSKVKKL